MKKGCVMEENIKLPRQVRSQQVKNRIFEAAVKLIKEHGYEYVTVNNVCSTAGVSVGSFYHHFANKDELISYYLVAGYEKYQAEFESAVSDDAVGSVVKIYQIYSRFCMEQGLEFIKNYYNANNKSLDTSGVNARAPGKLPILYETYVVLSKAQEDGYIRGDVDAEQLADDICTLEKGNIFEWALSDGRYDLMYQAERMTRNYMRSFLTQKYLDEYSSAEK